MLFFYLQTQIIKMVDSLSHLLIISIIGIIIKIALYNREGGRLERSGGGSLSVYFTEGRSEMSMDIILP